jgi:hypothetical protein
MDEEVVPVLHVEDAASAIAWYGRLGFAKECDLVDPDGNRLRVATRRS